MVKKVRGLIGFIFGVTLIISTVFNGCFVFASSSNNIISAGGTGLAIIKSDGTVAVGGNNNAKQYTARDWTNIVSIEKRDTYIYGVTADGNLKYTQSKSNELDSWTDLIMVSKCNGDIMGLKSDGTVYNTYKHDGTETWGNIISIAPKLGLKSDGTVEISKQLNGSDYGNDIKSWNNITKIVAFDGNGNGAIGIKEDGTVVYTGLYFRNKAGLKEIVNWQDIVDIDVGGTNHVVGLTKDGNVLVAGTPYYEGKLRNPADFSKFTDIYAISAAEYFVVGLKNDGSIVAAGSTWNGDDILLYIDSLN